MKLGLYSIFDSKLERYNIPYFARNDQEAVVILLRSGIPKSIYNDSKLYHLGDFDDSTLLDSVLVSQFSEVSLPPFPEVK